MNSDRITVLEKKRKTNTAVYLDHFFHLSFLKKKAQNTLKINQVYGVVKINKAFESIKNIVQINIK
jgi:hypothetical protein